MNREFANFNNNALNMIHIGYHIMIITIANDAVSEDFITKKLIMMVMIMKYQIQTTLPQMVENLLLVVTMVNNIFMFPVRYRIVQ